MTQSKMLFNLFGNLFALNSFEWTFFNVCAGVLSFLRILSHFHLFSLTLSNGNTDAGKVLAHSLSSVDLLSNRFEFVN